MRTLLLGIAVVACSGGSASKPSPSNVAASEAQPAAPNPARKWGYPTDAECNATIDHTMKISRTNPDAAKAIDTYGDEIPREAFQECRGKWMLGQLDCLNSATTYEQVDPCIGTDFRVPDGVDVSMAPGRATVAQCKAAVDHLVTIAPQTERAAVTDQCMRYWRPFTVACVMGSPTSDFAKTCTI